MQTEYEKRLYKYCDDITKKKILSGNYTKRAVKRFLSDLKRQEEEGFEYEFKFEYALEPIEFAESLQIPDIVRPDGDKSLQLLDWQIFIYANIFGWRYKSDSERRRFRMSYVELARKNGKTSGILYPFILYDFLTTDSAESYFVSRDGEQSEKSFKELIQIIRGDEYLNSKISKTVSAITYNHSRISFFSSESVGIDSYKNSMSIIDEYHAYDSDKIVTAFRYGGRARKNNLTLIITSAGNDIAGPCYSENERCRKILNGVATDENYFGIIYAYDELDDWKDAKNFIKANPSLGPILDPEVLNKDLSSAIMKPSEQPDFKSKTCGIWNQSTVSWLPIDKWEASINSAEYQEEELVSGCGALDLSNINDFTAWTMYFKIGEKFVAKHRFWIPESTVEERFRKENINIKEWIEKGWVTVIPGSTIDYDFVFDDITKDLRKYEIQRIHYDAWNSKYIIDKISKEFGEELAVPFKQNMSSMALPSKMFEKAIQEKKILDQNPVMAWMITCSQIKPDINGNFKPIKVDVRKSTSRIDGVITSIMAMDAVMKTGVKEEPVEIQDILALF